MFLIIMLFVSIIAGTTSFLCWESGQRFLMWWFGLSSLMCGVSFLMGIQS